MPVSDVRLLRWERSAFQHTLAEYPSVARSIFRMLTGKLRQDVSSKVNMRLAHERWEQDLARAREIQLGMLPRSAGRLAGAEVASHFASGPLRLPGRLPSRYPQLGQSVRWQSFTSLGLPLQQSMHLARIARNGVRCVELLINTILFGLRPTGRVSPARSIASGRAGFLLAGRRFLLGQLLVD